MQMERERRSAKSEAAIVPSWIKARMPALFNAEM
jgi:hypothetical protein